MQMLKTAWYRSFQMGLNIGSRFLYWRKPRLLTGCGSRHGIPALIEKEGVKKLMVVTGRHVGKTIAPEIMEELKAAGIDCVHYGKVEANPSTATVYEIEK